MIEPNVTALEELMPFIPPRRRVSVQTISRPRLLSKLIILSVSAFCIGASSPGAGAEPRQAPNSHVALDLGPSFVPSDRFAGFVDKSSGVSFAIVDMTPRAFDELKDMPTRTEALAQQGMSDVETGTLSSRSGDYVYFHGKQKTASGAFSKFVLILRENGVTAMINATVPQAALDAGKVSKAQIEDILAKAAVENEPAPAEELFRFTYRGPFKPVANWLGSSKLFSLSGTPPVANENRMVKEPMLIVSPSADERPVIDPKATAEKRFANLGRLQNETITSEKAVSIGGLNGYQIIGEAADVPSGEKITIDMVLLSGETGGYYAIIGTVPIADREKFMPEQQKVIASFELVKP